MTYDKSEESVIVVDCMQEITYRQKKLFLASLNEDNADRQKYADALIKIIGASVYNKLKANFHSQSFRSSAIERMQKAGVLCITIKSGQYPARLKNTSAPPLVLYAKGNTNLLSGNAFGVVGSRKSTSQALKLCKEITSQLTERFTIVTGIADGADSAAVSGALSSGKIICVLPCGHGGNCSANPALIREVEERGLTLSEYPPSTPAQKYTFLIRNRIIAGLSQGVLVVSAAKKSGALNTATYATDYSREVFALPYSVGVQSGEGCNALIKGGAILCESAADIFSAFGFEPPQEKQQTLTVEESAIVKLLKSEGELHVQSVANAIGKKPFEVAAICSALEIKGLIAKVAGNKYAAL